VKEDPRLIDNMQKELNEKAEMQEAKEKSQIQDAKDKVQNQELKDAVFKVIEDLN
jgi:hypothetical protein